MIDVPETWNLLIGPKNGRPENSDYFIIFLYLKKTIDKPIVRLFACNWTGDDSMDEENEDEDEESPLECRGCHQVSI